MTNSPEDEIKAGLAALWARSRPTTIRRAQALADAVEQLESGQATGEHAEVLAHKLAGSLGTFGLSEASALAKSIERELQQSTPAADTLRALGQRAGRVDISPRLLAALPTWHASAYDSSSP